MATGRWVSSLRASARRPLSILYWLPTGLFVSNYFFHFNTISGRSMQPTLNPDTSPWRDVALFSRFAVHTQHDYGRGDIVTFRSPENPKRLLIKRIIAEEGDVICTLPPYPDQEVKVPQGHVWVEGDEHFLSDDSNRFGPVSRGLIESKLIVVIWPLNRFGWLKNASSLKDRGKQLDRHAVDELRREQVRHSRVKIASASSGPIL